MTIREELKQELEQVKLERMAKEKAIEKEARNMINEFIIPKFREIVSKKPTDDYLTIVVYDCLCSKWLYTSNVDNNMKKILYSREAFFMAINFAKEEGIKVVESEDAYLPNYKFILDLR